MLRSHSQAGMSLAEVLVAVALMASLGAAMASGMSGVARLHRASELQTRATLVAAARLERVKAAAAGGLEPGGALDGRITGWHAWVDGEGASVEEDGAVFLCAWAVSSSGAGHVMVAAVRITPLASPEAAVTLSTAVRRE